MLNPPAKLERELYLPPPHLCTLQHAGVPARGGDWKAHPMTTDPLHIPKLSDVARRAGVGNATVSRALNGGRNVSPAKMERILAVARELNYKPNRVAQSLKGACSGMIAMIVPSISDLFFAQCAEAVETVARERGSLLVVLPSHDQNELILGGLERLLSQRIDGLILASSQPHSRELLRALRTLRVPVVGMDGPLTDAGLSSVLCENYEGACAAAEHLLGHGYSAVVSVQVKPNLYTMRERLRGYRAAMASAGRETREEVIATREDAVRVLRKYVGASRPSQTAPPPAFFASNNLSALLLYEAVHALRLSIPREVALLSFDDFDLADSLTPPMSVVQQPLEDLGRTAANLLFHEMTLREQGAPRAEGKPLLLAPRLVLRESCGCPMQRT